jgi:hypothetical protein
LPRSRQSESNRDDPLIFRRKDRGRGAAVAEHPETFEGLLEEIDELSRVNRAERDPAVERRILRLRHRAGAQLVADPGPAPDQIDPDYELLTNGSPLPEVTADELSAELVRAAILRHGSICVRGLIDRDEAARMAQEVQRAYDARAEYKDGRPVAKGYFEQFSPDPPYEPDSIRRAWVNEAAGMWGPDSPRVMFDVLDAFARAGLRALASDYLGGHPLISLDKCTLRRVEPDTWGSWHQDGAFLGDVRALNVWLSLSRCGDVAPGLDIVPRRLDHIVPTGTEGSFFTWDVAPDVAREAAGDVEIMRPTYEPGDVMLFDDLFLHSTATSPEMTDIRYAVETWFFAPTGFPSDYVPLAL